MTAVTASNTYTISAKDTSGSEVTANANDAGSGKGGGSTVATYQINVGLDDNSYGTGWVQVYGVVYLDQQQPQP